MTHLPSITLAAWLLMQTIAMGNPEAALQTVLQSITVPDGFRVELVYAVPLEEQGSWVALTPDPAGRLITSDEFGRLYRVTIGNDSSQTKVEQLDVPVGQVQGLLYAYDSLFVMVNNLNKTAGEEIAQVSGLYRLQDTNGDDNFDHVTLVQRLDGTGTANAHGEHGPHAIRLGPDGLLYFVVGNGVKVPENVDPISPYRVWADDLLIPSENTYVPGGWIARTDRAGTKLELLCGGLRNPYDIAFNSEGELFTGDADSEADADTHWYRPTRVNHIVSGGDYGWRSDAGLALRQGKWPDYYPESVGSVVDIGRGSPAGLTFGTGARFPARYQRALFVCDWQTATILTVDLEPQGATYRGTLEPFLTGRGLPVADLVVHPDGAMYFTIGGRKTPSGIFRIRYVGSERAVPVETIDVPRASQARQLRQSLEKFHGQKDARAIDAAWPHLASGDRAIRYAARVAVEWQDVTLWKDRALREEDPVALIQAMVALARSGGPQLQQQVLERLNRLPLDELSEAQLREMVRAYSLAFIRMGGPRDNANDSLIERLASLFPSDDSSLNRDLCRLLVYLDAPVVVDGTLELIRSAPNVVEKSLYIDELGRLKCDWSFPQHRNFLSLTGLDQIADNAANARTIGVIRSARQAVIDRLNDEDRDALREAIEGPAETNLEQTPKESSEPSRPFVKEWQLEEVVALMSRVESGRSYRNGRAAFEAATCVKCHQIGGDGGTTGPDLTAVGKRFELRYLLESLIVPSKVVSDRYRNELIATDDGLTVAGRVVYDDGKLLRVRTDPTSHKLIEIEVDTIETRSTSDVSEMPSGLLNVLTEEDIIDLIAYLRAGGNKDDAAFVVPHHKAAKGSPPEGFTALFNGRDLKGWKDDGSGHWRAEDGVLVYNGQGDHLFTQREYGDFILLIDWRIEDGGNSGIFLRGGARAEDGPQVEIWDKRDYDSDMGSGSIVPYTAYKPINNADNPIGEWNHFEIRVAKGRVSVKLNDQQVLHEQSVGFSRPRGPIVLQHHSTPLWFRNVYIRELESQR